MAKHRPTEDVTKLPKWAQDRISKLEADEKWWKARALEAAKGEDAEIRISEDFDERTYAGLPNGTRVEFVGIRENVRVSGRPSYFVVGHGDEYRGDDPNRLRLYVTAPDGRLLMRPMNANSIEIEIGVL